MKIAVLLKYYRGELNPFDAATLECALETGEEIVALAMAPVSVLPALESLTRLGVKAYLISDPTYAGSDTQATARVLAAALERLSPDVIFTGRQSIDGDTGQVPFMLAEILNMDIVSGVLEFTPEALTSREGKSYSLCKKNIYSFERIRSLRFPSIFSKKGKVQVIDNKTLGIDRALCGITGSPTRVIRSYESTVGRRDCKFIETRELDTLIKESLLKNRSTHTSEVKETKKIARIHYVGNIRNIAEQFADEAIELQYGNKTPAEFADELHRIGAQVVLFENTTALKRLSSSIAVITGAGLCADCIFFKEENGRAVMTRPALGGNVTADIVCESQLSLATVRPTKTNGSNVMFAVGKGAIEHLGAITTLAEKYNAELVCSRPLADAGIMPYAAQVGLTGKMASPRVYVTFGISGAVQHTCAISGAETVIAVNVDKKARIFDYADYGIITDLKNLILK